MSDHDPLDQANRDRVGPWRVVPAGFLGAMVLEVGMRFLILLPILALAGCGSFKERQNETNQQDAVKLAAERNVELTQRIAPQPQPTIVTTSNPKTGETTTTITPPPAASDIHYTEGSQVRANSKSSFWASESESYPFFVKLIGGCIGVVFLLIIWAYIRRQSAAVNAAYEAGDSLAAGHIRRIRERMQVSTNDAYNAQAATEIAALEADRGKLRGKK